MSINFNTLTENIIMGIDGIYLSTYTAIINAVNLICMSILHQRKDTGELHVFDPVNLLEICGLHVLYISLIRRTIRNFIFLPVIAESI